MVTTKTIISQSPSETEQVGKDLALGLKNGGVVLLFGDLGAGKTTFIKGLARGLGIKRRITSPTFVVVRRQNIPLTREKFLWHIDLYRMKDKAEIINLGIGDMVENGSIVAIEWPELVAKDLPENRVEVRFLLMAENTREIKISCR